MEGCQVTEAMLVAIVGISGVIIGTVLGGILTYKSTKAQIRARINELHEQFAHERKEKQITRLIERRASYLNPISENLQSITKSVHYIEKKLRDLVFLCGNDETVAWAHPKSGKYLEDMRNSVESVSRYMDNIEMLRTQNTDSQSGDLISNNHALSYEVTSEIYKLSTMQIRHGKGHVSNEPANKEISYHCTNAFNVSTKVFESIRKSNHRIEAILSGME